MLQMSASIVVTVLSVNILIIVAHCSSTSNIVVEDSRLYTLIIPAHKITQTARRALWAVAGRMAHGGGGGWSGAARNHQQINSRTGKRVGGSGVR